MSWTWNEDAIMEAQSHFERLPPDDATREILTCLANALQAVRTGDDMAVLQHLTLLMDATQ